MTWMGNLDKKFRSHCSVRSIDILTKAIRERHLVDELYDNLTKVVSSYLWESQSPSESHVVSL